MEFDAKEHANWLVRRGVPLENSSAEILRAHHRAAMFNLDDDGNMALNAAGQPTGVVTASIACGNCGLLRLFVLDVDTLPQPGGD